MTSRTSGVPGCLSRYPSARYRRTAKSGWGSSCSPMTTGFWTLTVDCRSARDANSALRRFTQPLWAGPVGVISTTWPSMSSTRWSSWRTPASPIRWYSSAVKRCPASGIAILSVLLGASGKWPTWPTMGPERGGSVIERLHAGPFVRCCRQVPHPLVPPLRVAERGPGGEVQKPALHQQGAHRLQDAAEGVEHETEDLERHDAEQRFRIPRLAEDDWRMAVALGERESTLRDRPAHRGPVGQDEFHLALRREADALPHRLGQERVGRSAVDQEANARFLPARTVDGALDVADTHAPDYWIAVGERRHPNIAERSKATPGEQTECASELATRHLPVNGRDCSASAEAAEPRLQARNGYP